MGESKFLTVTEAAEALHVSTKTVRRLISRKLLRASRALRKILIPKEDIDSFIERTCPELEVDFRKPSRA